MNKPTLLYYEILNYLPGNLRLMQDHFEVLSLADPGRDTPEILAKADVALAPLGYFFGAEKMDACKRLKVIGSNTTGHPHIDVDEAARRGLAVVTLKERHEFLDTITPTAELALGLIIAVTRNLLPATASVREGRFERWPFGGKRMLSRMSLGVAGLGRLGRKLGSYGLAMGMEVNYVEPDPAKTLAGAGRLGDILELAAASDIVSIHIPHLPETEKIFDAAFFRAMRPGSYFINTSRGELVDEAALLEGLTSGRLAGAAVDVLDGEFVPGFSDHVLEHPLVQYARENDNLVITPHIGGSTEDAWGLTQEFTLREIIRALEAGK